MSVKYKKNSNTFLDLNNENETGTVTTSQGFSPTIENDSSIVENSTITKDLFDKTESLSSISSSLNDKVNGLNDKETSPIIDGSDLTDKEDDIVLHIAQVKNKITTLKNYIDVKNYWGTGNTFRADPPLTVSGGTLRDTRNDTLFTDAPYNRVGHITSFSSPYIYATVPGFDSPYEGQVITLVCDIDIAPSNNNSIQLSINAKQKYIYGLDGSALNNSAGSLNLTLAISGGRMYTKNGTLPSSTAISDALGYRSVGNTSGSITSLTGTKRIPATKGVVWTLVFYNDAWHFAGKQVVSMVDIYSRVPGDSTNWYKTGFAKLWSDGTKEMAWCIRANTTTGDDWLFVKWPFYYAKPTFLKREYFNTGAYNSNAMYYYMGIGTNDSRTAVSSEVNNYVTLSQATFSTANAKSNWDTMINDGSAHYFRVPIGQYISTSTTRGSMMLYVRAK